MPLDYFGIDNPQLRQQTADHYNCMMRLDALIGDLLQVLEESGKAKDTLVAYFGDHGADMLRGKRTSYEGGTRIPLIIRWPGRTETQLVSTELVSLIDLAPTLLEATGAAPIPNLPGISLIPLMKGLKTEWRTHLFTEFHLHSAHNFYPQRTIRNGRYKLILNLMPGRANPGYPFTNNRFFEDLIATIDQAPEPIRSAYHNMERPPKFELYDLKEDPHEFNNLAEDPNYSDIRSDLEKRLDTWRHETRDPMLKHINLLRLKEEVDACFVEGQPDKAKLTLTYPEYFFE
ncbi:MAG: sulfatase-like hydrolase/transferase [Opitutae bacterium]|nr:sulfatase-like hydrolase/transferase [Opitutae bacterium]